jgi:hypothetical protein
VATTTTKVVTTVYKIVAKFSCNTQVANCLTIVVDVQLRHFQLLQTVANCLFSCSEWLAMQYFYRGLQRSGKTHLDFAAGGVFIDKDHKKAIVERWQIITINRMKNHLKRSFLKK